MYHVFPAQLDGELISDRHRILDTVTPLSGMVVGTCQECLTLQLFLTISFMAHYDMCSFKNCSFPPHRFEVDKEVFSSLLDCGETGDSELNDLSKLTQLKMPRAHL